MDARKAEIAAYYDRLFHLLYKKKVDRKVVKRLLYDDKETHIRLGIAEKTLNIMWDRLCRGSANAPRIDNVVTISETTFQVIKTKKKKKRKQAKKGGGKMAREIIQYDPSTNKEVKRFKNAIACAEELGLNANYIRRVAEGDVKHPSVNLRYADVTETVQTEVKPKRKYSKKVTIATVVPSDQELEVDKVIKEVIDSYEMAPFNELYNEPASELIDGYEELNETPLENKNKPNSFETAPDPEPAPQKYNEEPAFFGNLFQKSKPKIAVDLGVEIQHKPGDLTILEVLRRAYIQELKDVINDEVKKIIDEILTEETKFIIEGTKSK